MKKSIFLSISIILTISLSYGVPASPIPWLYTQPNGSQILLHYVGDEYYHWVETSENYIVVEQNGYYEYATIINNKIAPSGIIASTPTNKEQCAHLTQRSQLLNFLHQERKMIISRMDSISNLMNTDENHREDNKSERSAPLTIGNLKVLCILIGFPDKPFITPKINYENMWNQTGYSYEGSQGCIKDFYIENSYNQTNVTATVVGPYIASHNSSYYDTGTDISSSNVRELIREAISEAKSEIQFQDFDLNGDKYVDVVHVVFAGYAKDAGPTGLIWSHHWSLALPVWQGLYKAKEYICTSELANTWGTKTAPIGTVCHEYGHHLGSPDYYSTNDSLKGTGRWDVMASGSWNNNGRCPAHHNPYTKAYIYNWITPAILNSNMHGYTYNIPPSYNTASIYRINTNTSEEFFLLENKKTLGFNSYIVNTLHDGLLIYHIHSNIQNAINNNAVNNSHPQNCYIVSANATSNPNSVLSSYDLNELQWAYPTSNQIFFTNNSIPSAISWAGVSTGVNICFIQKNGNNIKFVVNPYILGSNTIDTVNIYRVPNIPPNAQINWTYSATVEPHNPYLLQMFPPISFLNGNSSSVISIKRNQYLISQSPSDTLIPPFPGKQDNINSQFVWKDYIGTITLKATISCGGESHEIIKTITLPDNTPSMLTNKAHITDTDIQNILDARNPHKLQLCVKHPNPIIGNNLPISIYQIHADNKEPFEHPYIIEIWGTLSGRMLSKKETTGNTSLEIGTLPSGLYNLFIIVNNEIIVREKLVRQ